jgi:hypothetical protein
MRRRSAGEGGAGDSAQERQHAAPRGQVRDVGTLFRCALLR